MDTPPDHETPSLAVKYSAHPHVRPDAKQQRYDRQLRLWAASGQTALESAHILVVNAGATATSILKNLVLPGTGQFTLLDDKRVMQQDLGNNFFLQPGSSNIGVDYRAEQAAKYLSELNGGVKAGCLTESVASFLQSSADPLAPFSLVISVNTDPEETLLISDKCWEAGVPLIAVKSCGFIGSARTQMQEAHFIETHPDQEATLDLRLDAPFPSLAAHAASIDFSTLDTHEYAHIPPIVILLQALQTWKSQHGGNLPSNFKEKKEFRTLVDSMKRGGKNADHENFEQATGMVMKVVKETKIPQEVEELFKDPQCENLTEQSAPFWILLRAIRDFVESPETSSNQRHLPLHGSLPDMKATTTGYNTLLSLYRGKSKEDLAWIKNRVDELIKEKNIKGKGIDDEMINVFVKNAPFVKVVKGRKMRDEYERPDTKAIHAALQAASQPDPFVDPEAERPPWTNVKSIHFYLALRAADTFYVEHSRWPGDFPPPETAENGESENEESPDKDEKGIADVEKDFEELKECAVKVAKVCLGEEDAAQLLLQDNEAFEMALSEVTRAGASDLPQIAALLGGIVAQEAIKIVTKQYVPLNGTVIFDGIKSASDTFDF